MKKFLFALLALMILSATTAAAEPVRIARLPIIFQSMIPDEETRAELEVKISLATHIPMNQTLQVAEYLPTEESTRVMNEIWQKMRAADKKAKIQDAMKPLARELNADIIICPILRQYTQNSSFGATPSGETFIYSHVRAELIIYDRRTDNLIDKKATQFYRDAYTSFGTASYLSKVCFDKLIDATKLRQMIFAIGR